MLNRKPLELSPEVAKAFKDMHAFQEGSYQAQIAARQRFALSQFQGPATRPYYVPNRWRQYHARYLTKFRIQLRARAAWHCGLDRGRPRAVRLGNDDPGLCRR